MARPLRIEYDGALYHITSRGNGKKPLYKDDEDRKNFLKILKRVNERFKWICHAYCLMKNHYHIVIETPDGNLSKGMRQLNGVYTQIFNRRHKRVGHIFQGRYKAILIQKESYLLEVCRYVVLNPVRARVAEKPEKWKWSSFGATAGIKKSHPCLTTEWILGQFSKRKKDAERKYRDFVKAGKGVKNIWKEVKGQCILGGQDFVKGLIGYVSGYKGKKEIPKRHRYINRPELGEIFRGIWDKGREKRNRKIKLATEGYGYSQKEVADYLGIHYSTVSLIVNTDYN